MPRQYVLDVLTLCVLDEQQHLRTVAARWHARVATYDTTAPPEQMRRLAASGHAKWFWACDRCVSSGTARAADIDKQRLGMGTPFAAYVPRPCRCEDCRVDAVFTPQEQKLWFETLGFLIWVDPKQCLGCRRVRRQRRRDNDVLAAALRTLDPRDPKQLDEVAQLDERLGSPKAQELRARANNRRRRAAPTKG